MSPVHGILLTLALFACSGEPFVVEPEHHDPAERLHRLLVTNHGWHTGLIIPARHLNALIPEFEDRFASAAYYELGWGDQDFYQAREIATGLAVQALFWSTGAAIHVVAVPGDPREYFSGSEILEICIDEPGLNSLKAFLANSFAPGIHGQVVELSKGIYRESRFYAGTGRYSLLNTSNTWTAKALKSAGVAINPTFSLTAGSVMHALGADPGECGIGNSRIRRRL
ncbi:MAG: TIGR02117 family protein [Gammaproteobacteria bacterium]